MASYFDLAREEDIAPLLADPRPAWLWNAGGDRILWCNPAGAQVFALGGFNACQDIRFSGRSAAAGHLARIGRQAPGTPAQLGLLRFQFGVRSIALPCQCRVLRIGDLHGVLAVAIAPDAGQPADLEAGAAQLLTFLGGDLGSMAVVDEGGAAAAGALPAPLAGHQDLVSSLTTAADPVTVTTDDGAFEIDAIATQISDIPAFLLRWRRVSATETPMAMGGPEADAEPQHPDREADSVDTDPPSMAMDPAEAAEAAESGVAPEPDDDMADWRENTAVSAVASPDLADPDDTEAEQATTSDTEGDAAAHSVAAASEISPDRPSDTDDAFTPKNHPDRFVWQMDENRVFTALSEGLAEAVGREAANLIGRDWAAISSELGIDPDGVIGELLRRGDTWSGITVDWPVAGTVYRVPVDLAALPNYDRNRDFKGFRGFGVCRTADFIRGTVLYAPTDSAVATPAADDGTRGGPGAPADMTVDDTLEIGEGILGEEPEFYDIEPPQVFGSAPNPADLTDRQDADSEMAESLERARSDRGVHVIPVPYGNVKTETENVVSLHGKPDPGAPDDAPLSKPDREAFEKIASALGARIEADETAPAAETAIDREDDGATAKSVTSDRQSAPAEPVDEPTVEEDAAAAAGDEASGVAPGDREDDEDVVVRLPSAFAPAAPRIDPRLIDRLPIGVLICRGDQLLYANETVLDLLGYGGLGDLRDAGGLDAVFTQSNALPRVPYADAPSDRTVGARHRTGSTIAVQARMFRVPWDDGSALMISLSQEADSDTIDAATAAAAGRQAAEERAEELESILETATDGVIVLTRDGKILSVNRSAQALFDAEQDAMIGANISEFMARESKRATLDYLDGLANSGVASVLNDGREVIGRPPAGGRIPLFMTIGQMGAGEHMKFCAVLRDITQWKKAEEDLTSAKHQAETASTQKSDFLARISHEIRTPLNAIIGFSEVMMDERFGKIGTDRYKEYLQDIHTSGMHIMSLINDLLDLSKVEAGKMEMSFEAVVLADVISECLALVEPQANQERVIIRSSLSETVPKVVADARSVRQIVLNLLSNAIKFNVTGGQVIISTSLEENGEVIIRVRDTGVGMSDKDIKTALEPFRQLHTARSGLSGSGLGLPLTKALAEANRAAFAIESNVNQGTIVSVAFPSTRVLAE